MLIYQFGHFNFNGEFTDFVVNEEAVTGQLKFFHDYDEEAIIEDALAEDLQKNSSWSSQILKDIDLILANELNFDFITTDSSPDTKFNSGLDYNSRSIGFLMNQPIDHSCLLNNVSSEKCPVTTVGTDSHNTINITDVCLISNNSQTDNQIKTCLGDNRPVVGINKNYILRSRHSSVHTNDTDYEDSYYTHHGTLSGTESFSELRLSLSETHSELNSSDVSEVWLHNDRFNLPSFKNENDHIYDFRQNDIDDTSCILYKMSEQINKVPKYIRSWKIPTDCNEEIFKVLSNESQVNDTNSILECKVFQCDQQISKGPKELAQLEASVEQMLCQVEIQETLLKEDVNFVPLLLDKKEAKALPILVDTLCVSPQVKLKPMQDLLVNHDDIVHLVPNIVEHIASPGIDNHQASNMISIDRNESPCTMSELEQSVNKLLSKVEKEEERLSLRSPSLDLKCLSTTSTSDISSDDDSYHGVWWEGAYRSLPRHSCRKRLTKHSNNNLKLHKLPPKNIQSNQNSDDSDTSRDTITHGLETRVSQYNKLIVKTIEHGKSAVEVRTCHNLMKNTTSDSNSQFYRQLSKAQTNVHSIWKRSLPSLRESSPTLTNSSTRSLGSEESLNYIKYFEPSEYIQYFTPCPNMSLDSTAYCTWAQRHQNEGKNFRILFACFSVMFNITLMFDFHHIIHFP